MSKPSKNKTNNNLFAPLAVGFFIGAITAGCVFLMWNHDREPRRYTVPPVSPTPVTPTAPPVPDTTTFSGLNSPGASNLDPAVAHVASRFVCSCGRCGDERLDVCSCERARAERGFIQEQLRAGRTEAEAVEALNQKYGGLKS